MLFRRPRLTQSRDSPSLELLREALDQYGVRVLPGEGWKNLRSLNIDELDLLEVLHLVESYVGVRVDRKIIASSTTITQLAVHIDKMREKSGG